MLRLTSYPTGVLPEDAPCGIAPTIRAVAQNPHAVHLVLADPGGPLDAADPDDETLRAQRAHRPVSDQGIPNGYAHRRRGGDDGW